MLVRVDAERYVVPVTSATPTIGCPQVCGPGPTPVRTSRRGVGRVVGVSGTSLRADVAERPAADLGVERHDVDGAVEVVHLVLQRLGHQPGALEHDLGTVDVDPADRAHGWRGVG